MKRKFLLALLSISMMIACTIGLAACGESVHEHEWSSWDLVRNPTCTEDGSEGRHCIECGERETRSIEATGHEFTEWYITEQPTCARAGTEVRDCPKCGTVEGHNIDPLGHKIVFVEEVSATCTEAGVKEHYECERCLTPFSDEEGTASVTKQELTIPKTRHQYVYEHNDTLHWEVCTVCGYKRSPFSHYMKEYESYGECECGYRIDHTAGVKADYSETTGIYTLFIDTAIPRKDVWAVDYSTAGVPKGARVRIDNHIENGDYYVNLKKVSFGNLNVVAIDNFTNCAKLTEINIPSTVTEIGDDAFNNCTSLTKVMFAGGVEKSALKKLGSQAFGYCAFTDFTVPASVTEIGHGAFNFNTALKNIEFPENISTLEPNMFNGCTALEEFTIPSTVTEIGEYAFQNCVCLKSMVIPEDVKSIGRSAFAYCRGLTSVCWLATDCNDFSNGDYPFMNAGFPQNMAFPSEGIHFIVGANVTKIPAYLFSPNANVTVVEFEENSSCKTIGELAFFNCDMLVLEIPDSVTVIGERAFEKCSLLKSLTIGIGVQEIGYSAFTDCNSLTELRYNATNCTVNSTTLFYDVGSKGQGVVVTIGANVQQIPANLFSQSSNNPAKIIEVKFEDESRCQVIGDSAFESCYTLQSITLPDSVTKISNGAFAFCKGLENVQFGKGIRQICSNAFRGCQSLESITIPENVETIEPDAFINCTALSVINWNTTAFKNEENPTSLFDTTGDETKGITVYIGASVTAIHDYVFSHSETIRSLKFAEGSQCTSIGDNAFYYCRNLVDIQLPNSIRTIGDDAFSYCRQLTELVIPDGVTTVGTRAFGYCTALKSIVIPDTITDFNSAAFYESSNIVSATFPCDIAWCIPKDSLTTAIVTNGDNLPSSAFSGGSLLTSVTLPDSLTSIGDHAFSSCNNLKAIDIPDNVTSIGASAFMYCGSLDGVVLPKNISIIEDYTFAACKSLTNIYIPEGVTAIYRNAFYGCDSLTTVYYGGNEESWNAINFTDGNETIQNANILYNETLSVENGSLLQYAMNKNITVVRTKETI